MTFKNSGKIPENYGNFGKYYLVKYLQYSTIKTNKSYNQT